MDGTIVICTFNGAEKLPDTLAHLAALKRPGNWEIMLVDNASTDNTATVAIKVWAGLGNPYPLMLTQQLNPGKSYALAMGIQKAQGDLIIICDDDNWLQQDYLMVASDKFRQHADLGIAGGVTVPVAHQPLPQWFNDYGYYYACGKRAETEFDFTGGKFLWGAGMVIPRHLALKIAGIANPQLLTCRKKDELISGGDDELCLRTWLLGYRTIFFPDLVLQHFMTDNRLTTTYRDRLLEGFSVQSETINAYRVLFSLQQRKKGGLLIIKKILHLIWCSILNDNKKVTIVKNYIFFLTNGKLYKNQTLFSILRWYTRNISV